MWAFIENLYREYCLARLHEIRNDEQWRRGMAQWPFRRKHGLYRATANQSTPSTLTSKGPRSLSFAYVRAIFHIRSIGLVRTAAQQLLAVPRLLETLTQTTDVWC